MGFFQGDIFSRSFVMENQEYVSIPHDGRQYTGDGNPKTHILLHGLSDNASGWARRSQADYFAEKYGISIVIPEVQRSFYQDMYYGARYYEYVSAELPELIQKMFKVSTEPEDLFVAGLSMGGMEL
jgi:S-formylglutathione hydrolase FrmB